MFQRDLTDLQGDDRYDQTIVQRLSADDEHAQGTASQERAFSDRRARDQNRGRVTLYEVYIPELRQIGTLNLNADGSSGWIRPLAPYHGPKLGPFVFFGVYLVPGQVYPLSPIAAMAEQDAELNAHAAAGAKEASSGKNLVLVSADQPEVAAAIERADTNSVVRVKGLNANMVVPVAVGGTSEQRLQYLQILLQRTDRIAGQSDAARGKAQGVTATEAQLANSNSDARTEFVNLKYVDGVAELLLRVGWYPLPRPRRRPGGEQHQRPDRPALRGPVPRRRAAGAGRLDVGRLHARRRAPVDAPHRPHPAAAAGDDGRGGRDDDRPADPHHALRQLAGGPRPDRAGGEHHRFRTQDPQPAGAHAHADGGNGGRDDAGGGDGSAGRPSGNAAGGGDGWPWCGRCPDRP